MEMEDNTMDIESPEAADILVRTMDANSKAIKELVERVKKLEQEVRQLKEDAKKRETP